MEPLNSSSSCCRNCRHYQPEGRRGGYCHQLGVPVQGSWNACSLVCLAFTPAWQNLNQIMSGHPGISKGNLKPMEAKPASLYKVLGR